MMKHKTNPTANTTFAAMSDAYYTVTEGCNFPLVTSAALWNALTARSDRKHTNAATTSSPLF